MFCNVINHLSISMSFVINDCTFQTPINSKLFWCAFSNFLCISVLVFAHSALPHKYRAPFILTVSLTQKSLFVNVSMLDKSIASPFELHWASLILIHVAHLPLIFFCLFKTQINYLLPFVDAPRRMSHCHLNQIHTPYSPHDAKYSYRANSATCNSKHFTVF